jgi:membrane-associated phospholipid phosphatase
LNYQNLFKFPCLFAVIIFTLISYLFLDLPLAHWILEHLQWMKPLTKLVYIVFSGALILPITAVLLGLSWKLPKLKQWRDWLSQLFCALFVAQIILAVLKVLVGRARPYQALLQSYQSFEPLHFNNAFFSFPSGHTLNIMLIAGFLSLRYPLKAWLFLSLGLILSFFRVLGLDHFLSDWILTVYLSGVILIWTQMFFRCFFPKGIKF